MNIKKKNLFFSVLLILLFVFLLFQINLINSQEAELTEIQGISSTEFTYKGDSNVEIVDGKIGCKTGIETCKIEIRKGDFTTTIEATQGVKFDPVSGRVSIAESGAEFSINGNLFKNIDSGEIILDQTNGKITEAKFFTNTDGGTYDINGNEFNVPGNKEFIYPSKKGGFQLPGGTEVLETQKNIQIESDGIIKYKGNELSGVLNFDENKNAFVNIREKVVVNGVSIENSVPSSYGGSGKGDELIISFNKNDPNLKDYSEYVVLDKEKNYFEYTNKKLGPRTAGKQTILQFEEGNSFYEDIFDSEKDYLGIEAKSSASGTLSIYRPSKNTLPILEVKEAREISLLQDSSTINFGEHISFSQNKIGKLGTVPMRIEFKDKQVVGLIPDDPWKLPGKKGGKFFLWSGKTELVKSTFGESGVGSIGQLSSIEEKKLEEWITSSEVRIDLAESIYAMAIDPSFAGSLKDSKDAAGFLENMYPNKQIGLSEVMKETVGENNIHEIEDLQTGLEIWSINSSNKGAINPTQFANQIANLENQKIKTSISFDELEKKIGTQNTQNLKSQTKKLVNSYFSYFQKTGDPVYLERVMGRNEIDSLKDCVNAGGNFGSCFDQEYNFYGPKTDLCIKNRNYCPILNAGELFRILF